MAILPSGSSVRLTQGKVTVEAQSASQPRWQGRTRADSRAQCRSTNDMVRAEQRIKWGLWTKLSSLLPQPSVFSLALLVFSLTLQTHFWPIS